jgi:hypothetical protein
LLPFLDQANLQNLINYSLPYNSQLNVPRFRVPVFLCPSEINDKTSFRDGIDQYPVNYGVNQGEWLVFDPTGRMPTQGAFLPNSLIRAADFMDGMSNTLGFAEVKAFQPNVKGGAAPSTVTPSDPSVIQGLGGSGEFDPIDSHTEWVEGKVHQTGFTTTFTPNLRIPFVNGGVTYDVDYTSAEENLTVPTFAAVTARSHHTGIVQVLLMDGSSRTISNQIDRTVWRSLGTRAGGEIVSEF